LFHNLKPQSHNGDDTVTLLAREVKLLRKIKMLHNVLFPVWQPSCESDIIVGRFRRALKTHLFGHWQLQCRVTVFFACCVQIRLLTYLLTYLLTLYCIHPTKKWILD